MKKVTIWSGVVLTLCGILAMGSPATAGTLGKVTGRVVDAKGGPLPGVSVVLEGTRRGAVTDKDGTYLILLVDPGVYSATASLIGFHSVTKKEVRVQADFTTTVDFQLQEKAVEMAEMVVAAERPPVEPDKTESRYVVTAKDIAQTPILRRVQDFVSLEPGMSKDGSEVIRNGLISDNAIYVDGVRLQSQDGRGTSFFQQPWWGVNVKAIQEISVVTGGMNAEYGNAQAGVINMVTRDGSEKYHGEMEYRFTPAGQKHWGANVYDAPEHRGHTQWNNPAWVAEVDPVTGRLAHQRLNYTDWRGHSFDGNVSGPLAKSAYFFFSAQHNRDAAIFPGPWNTRPFNLRASAKLTVPVGSDVKLRFGWLYERSKDFQGGGLANSSTPDVLRTTGRDIFLPAGSPAATNINTENAVYVVLTHTLSPRTFYELRVSRYDTKQDTVNAGRKTAPDIRTDKEGWFYLGRDNVWDSVVGREKRTGLKLDLSSQVSKGHFVKAGVDFTAYNNWLTWEGSTPAQQKHIEFIGLRGLPDRPVKPKQLAFYLQDKMEFQGLVINAGLRYDRFWGVDVPLIAPFRAYIYTSMSRFMQSPWFPMKPVVNWSPRLGISHPITSRSSLHFFYGHFYQLPGFRRMFKEQWFTSGAGIPGVPYSDYRQAGRPTSSDAVRPVWTDTQQTINFELGTDWNFVSDYTVALTSFFKSGSFREVGGWGQTFEPISQARQYVNGEANVDWEDIQGFEFSLHKGFNHYFSFRAAFNVDWMKRGDGAGGDITGGMAYVFDSTFVATSPYMVKWEEGNGVQRPVPLTAAERAPLASAAVKLIDLMRRDPQYFAFCEWTPGRTTWDNEKRTIEEAKDAARGIYLVTDDCPYLNPARGRATQGSLQTYFSLPPDFGPGPKIAGSTLLGGLSANMIYRVYTGPRFNYTTLKAQTRPARGPLHTNVDLSVQKRLSLGGLNADLFLEVFNLFNQKDTNASGTDYMWWGLQKPRPDDATYLQYGDLQDRTRYVGNPRQWNVGMRLIF